MTAPFEELAALDKRVHEPARLAILTALDACEEADFVYLQRLTGLSKGNLSAHLTRLDDGGLVSIDKRFVGKTPRTTIRLSDEGIRAVAAHWQQLDELRRASARWRRDGPADT